MIELCIRQKLFATVKDGMITNVSTNFTLDDGLSGLCNRVVDTTDVSKSTLDNIDGTAEKPTLNVFET